MRTALPPVEAYDSPSLDRLAAEQAWKAPRQRPRFLGIGDLVPEGLVARKALEIV